MPNSFARAVIVKTSGKVGTVHLSVNGRSREHKLLPLMPSLVSPNNAAAQQAAWHEMPLDTDENPWDICHQLLQHGFGAAGGPPVHFAEPDIEQQWIAGEQRGAGFELEDSCGPRAPRNEYFPPQSGSDYWHLADNFSQLSKASAMVKNPSNKRVRIAHLDTGIDPAHATLPNYVDLKWARNFIDAQYPNDATDRSTGWPKSLGHGTGTIGILAGRAVAGGLPGGAANLTVVPVRVADWVVQFKTSSIARGLDYVHQLNKKSDTRIHVLTMSLGGVASRAWAEAVNALYDSGVCIVSAAGNNFGNTPTRFLVHPARFHRVIAACGVMADGRPYADLPVSKMAGNYGPKRLMDTAMAAYTPNIPWPRIGCPNIVDLDGAGTSSATPQIAAAAALWIQYNLTEWNKYPQSWMRVEAVRRALFDSAEKSPDVEHFGNGLIRGLKALAIAPPLAKSLTKRPLDTTSFSILRLLTGLGANASGTRIEMLELEALQLSQRSKDVADVFESTMNSDNEPTDSQKMAILERLREDKAASGVLRQHVDRYLGVGTYRSGWTPPASQTAPGDEAAYLARALAPNIAEPACRELWVYTHDPLLGTDLETLDVNTVRLSIRWEDVKPGPVGEYLEVLDIDPPSKQAYAPVDLNNPRLGGGGLTPSESHPQFHQQMVYAVGMKTIERFERALGRAALWAARPFDRGRPEQYVQRLRIYPHALREQNAYYSPEEKALLFGYFRAPSTGMGRNLPGGRIFTCLSHDVVAHEMTHALLDGIHPRFRENTNPDVYAFHEAFADIVALLQHFAVPIVLEHQIARTRGDLRKQNLLGELAYQFGEASGSHGALRSGIGKKNDETGAWEPYEPSVNDYKKSRDAGPHALGEVLVAAVFDAFLTIAETRSKRPILLATDGTGVLPPGNLPHFLAKELARTVSNVAAQVLRICIRALDYCPPVDITFSEYLRALVTADKDLVDDDQYGYRVAFINAFSRRGIYPDRVASYGADAVAWQSPAIQHESWAKIISQLSFNWKLDSKRREAYEESNRNAELLHHWLMDKSPNVRDIRLFGLERELIGKKMMVGGRAGTVSRIEVHSVRPAARQRPDGQVLEQVVIEITQKWIDSETKLKHRGGCTVIVDRDSGDIRYLITKRVGHQARVEEERSFRLSADNVSPYCATLREHSGGDEPFAAVHRQ